jgi:hypothetical protein
VAGRWALRVTDAAPLELRPSLAEAFGGELERLVAAARTDPRLMADLRRFLGSGARRVVTAPAPSGPSGEASVLIAPSPELRALLDRAREARP